VVKPLRKGIERRVSWVSLTAELTANHLNTSKRFWIFLKRENSITRAEKRKEREQRSREERGKRGFLGVDNDNNIANIVSLYQFFCMGHSPTIASLPTKLTLRIPR